MTDERSAAILRRLDRLRDADAPTHGGRVLSYVYDSGLAELDDLGRHAANAVSSLNGLDPTTFPSIARMERAVLDFARTLVHGDQASGGPPVGLVTSGGTESCLLAVKSARDRWRARGLSGTPRLLVPVSAHAAFHKAAEYFDLDLDVVGVDASGRPSAADLIAAMTESTALVVVSAPSYPYGALDPVAEVAAAAGERGIACHVDACIGGWVLPFWDDSRKMFPPWDFRVPGVTSISLDAHKYGFAPKGASVLLFADRDAKRAAAFATTRWPGYPVVNATLLGSRSATALAATWAVIEYLGTNGFRELTTRTQQATRTLLETIAGIDGLAVVGDPVGPLFAVTSDTGVPAERRVDPHQWSDAVRELGWVLQPQPGLRQPNGEYLPPTTHLTVTPVTLIEVDALGAALRAAADAVRGSPPIDGRGLVNLIPPLIDATGHLDAEQAHAILSALGLGSTPDGAATPLPTALAPVMALLEVIEPSVAESLLTELISRLNEPD